MRNQVLIVDDDGAVLRSLYRVLRDEVDRVFLADSAEEGLQLLSMERCQIVITDQFMRGIKGADFLVRVRQLHPEIVRIMLTAHATPETAVKAVNEGEVYRLLTKPWDDHVLRQTVRDAIKRYDELRPGKGMKRMHEKSVRQLLERSYPGISRVNKDRSGCHRLNDLDEKDLVEVTRKLQEIAYLLQD